MKTTKKISVLSLVLILAAVNTSFSGTGKPGFNDNITPGIRYQVNVHLTADLALCNTYLVQVVDESGRLVAQPKRFVPGISIYTFVELPLPIGILRPLGWKAKRTAMLISAGSGDVVCTTDLVTRPDSKVGTFVPGQTYSFNLYPGIIVRKTLSEPKPKD